MYPHAQNVLSLLVGYHFARVITGICCTTAFCLHEKTQIVFCLFSVEKDRLWKGSHHCRGERGLEQALLLFLPSTSYNHQALCKRKILMGKSSFLCCVAENKLETFWGSFNFYSIKTFLFISAFVICETTYLWCFVCCVL